MSGRYRTENQAEMQPKSGAQRPAAIRPFHKVATDQVGSRIVFTGRAFHLEQKAARRGAPLTIIGCISASACEELVGLNAAERATFGRTIASSSGPIGTRRKNLADRFEFEEYKQLCEEVRNYQNNYTKLENLTFGGVIALYGFFLINIDKIPWAAWFAIPFFVSIAGVRCIGYYWLLNKRHADLSRKLKLNFIAIDTKVD
jgi:hypothetical protein